MSLIPLKATLYLTSLNSGFVLGLEGALRDYRKTFESEVSTTFSTRMRKTLTTLVGSVNSFHHLYYYRDYFREFGRYIT